MLKHLMISLLVVQQVSSIFQCFDGSLNAYLYKCLEIIATFDDFTIQHVSRDENTVANDLAKEASGFQSNRGKLYVLKKKLDVLVCNSKCSNFQLMHNLQICSTEPSSAKFDVPKSETEGSDISRT
jgi:hypothetical protein